MIQLFCDNFVCDTKVEKMKLLIVLVIVATIASCRKDDEITPQNEAIELHPVFHLENNTGSYWLYEWFEIDSLGNETSLQTIDSVYVVGDSVISGNVYTHYSGTYQGNQTDRIIRDSSGYIVTSLGNIQYSRVNFTDTLHYTEDIGGNMKSYWFTKKLNNDVVTPSGSYQVYDMQGHFYSLDGTPFTSCDSLWIQHKMYHDLSGVEIISQTAFVSQLQNNCTYLERRLIFSYYAP